eukprot:TCONS_00068709-protein
MKMLLTNVMMLATTILVTTAWNPCQDNIWRCNNYHQPKGLRYVKRACKGYVKIYCRNLCSSKCWQHMAKKEPTTTTTTTTTTTPTTSTTRARTCFDKSNACNRYTNYCRTSLWMKRNCQQTCGFCNGGTTTTTPTTTTTT